MCKGMMRTLKSHLELDLDMKITREFPIYQCMVEWAAEEHMVQKLAMLIIKASPAQIVKFWPMVVAGGTACGTIHKLTCGQQLRLKL